MEGISVDVNEAYEQWLGAAEEAKEETQTALWMTLKQYLIVRLGSINRKEPNLADDIATTVILKLDQFRGGAQFSTWVESILRHKKADFFAERKERRERFT